MYTSQDTPPRSSLVCDLLTSLNSLDNGKSGSGDLDKSQLRRALSQPKVRSLVEWDIPKVQDVTSKCDVRGSGSVMSIRMDKLSGARNLKKPVVSGLIVLQSLRGIITENTLRLVDAGNMNMGFSLKYFCKKLDLSGVYIMSRLFDDDMVRRLHSPGFKVVQAPASDDVGMEREFYTYLVSLMKKSSFRQNTACLWHARYSRYVMEVFGEELSEMLDFRPDKMVVGVGSGATLSALARVRNLHAEDADIIVPEHVESPVMSDIVDVVKCINDESIPKCPSDQMSEFRSHSSDRVPHFVIGPHYEEANPYLEDDVESIDEVWQYSDPEWMGFSRLLSNNSLRVGNSSAANLLIARCLADLGYDVLTATYEPMRSYYVS